MANPEHLDILKEGVEVWNAWRAENEGVRIDLSGADLAGAKLTEADLTGADLREAKLVMADLREAHLREADLTKAKLSGAHLREADLTKAKLSWANLDSANLTDAYLLGSHIYGANLTGADLTGANVEEAILYNTVFADTNLSGTKGLDKCQHLGPSVLDHRTLAKSGTLPMIFLRGCGLPDFIIDKIEVLRGDPIRFHSCFISYSSQDDDFTKRLHDDLQEAGVRCWFAPEDLKIGDEIRPAIDTQIRLRDKLLLILSEHSITSQWVKDEVEAAYEEEARRGKTILFPIRLDEAVMDTDTAWASKLRRQRHIGDFCRWKDHDAYSQALERLLKDLKTEP